jgi:hypothetical protein
MSLSENVSTRTSYKFYASGEMESNELADSTADLGASGAQQLRRTEVSLNLKKNTYGAEEIRTDRQRADFRHGPSWVEGSIKGELSPGTYWEFIEAACRATEAAAIATTNTDFTSVSADSTTSLFTFAAGDPVSSGYRVGMILRFTNLSESANNSKNFIILGFGGTSNREVTVYPAPTTMGADSAFNLTSVGKRVYPPASSHVQRKVAVETWHTDTGVMRLFTENRVGGVSIEVPASGNATIDIPMMGRAMETGSSDDTPATAPFFTSPTAATTTTLTTAVNGLCRVGGTNVGVITSVSMAFTMSPERKEVVGQEFTPEIFLKTFMGSGQFVAMLQDDTFINYFKNETEIEILLYLKASSSDAADAITVHLPRVKLGDAAVNLNTEAAIMVTCPFEVLKYEGAAAGYDQTTVAFCDTAA